MKFIYLIIGCVASCAIYAQGDLNSSVRGMPIECASQQDKEQLGQLMVSISGAAHNDFENFRIARGEVARLLLRSGAPEQGLTLLEELRDMPEFPPITNGNNFHRTLALHYLEMEDYDNALLQFDSALMVLDRWRVQEGSDTIKTYAHILNNMGITHQRANQIRAAESKFWQARQILERRTPVDSNYLASIRDNQAMLLMEEGKLDAALPLLTENLQFWKPERKNKLIQTDLRIAQCHIRLSNYGRAQHILVRSIKEINLVPPGQRAYLYELILSATKELATATNDQELLNTTLEKTIEYREVLESYRDEVLQAALANFAEILNLRWQWVTEKETLEHNTQLVLEEEKRRRSEQEIWFLLIGSAILLMLIILFLWTRSNRLKASNLIAKLNQRVAEADLENERLRSSELSENLDLTQQDLTNAALEISRKQKWLEQLQTRLLAETKDQEVDRKIRSVISDLKLQMSLEEKNEKLFSQINQANQGFYSSLRKDYPNLTQKELELCALVRLSMSNKEIATYRNVAPESVKKARMRLRKKLGLTPEIRLHNFLQGV